MQACLSVFLFNGVKFYAINKNFNILIGRLEHDSHLATNWFEIQLHDTKSKQVPPLTFGA